MVYQGGEFETEKYKRKRCGEEKRRMLTLNPFLDHQRSAIGPLAGLLNIKSHLTLNQPG